MALAADLETSLGAALSLPASVELLTLEAINTALAGVKVRRVVDV